MPVCVASACVPFFLAEDVAELVFQTEPSLCGKGRLVGLVSIGAPQQVTPPLGGQRCDARTCGVQKVQPSRSNTQPSYSIRLAPFDGLRPEEQRGFRQKASPYLVCRTCSFRKVDRRQHFGPDCDGRWHQWVPKRLEMVSASSHMRGRDSI